MGESAQVQGQTSAGSQPISPNPGGNYLAMGMTAAGGITSALANLQAGRTNQAIANDNAQVATAHAQEAENAGAFAANQAQARGRQIEAVQRAGQAGGGTVAGAGTGGAVTASTESTTAMDKLMIERNAARQAMGLQTQAAGDIISGTMQEAQGRQQALSTLLNTGSQEWLESDPLYRGFSSFRSVPI